MLRLDSCWFCFDSLNETHPYCLNVQTVYFEWAGFFTGERCCVNRPGTSNSNGKDGIWWDKISTWIEISTWIALAEFWHSQDLFHHFTGSKNSVGSGRMFLSPPAEWKTIIRFQVPWGWSIFVEPMRLWATNRWFGGAFNDMPRVCSVLAEIVLEMCHCGPHIFPARCTLS